MDFTKLKEILGKELEGLNVIVHNIEYINEDQYNFLRITLDKINGIDLESIVEATRIIDPIIEDQNLIEDSYILDVVSRQRGED